MKRPPAGLIACGAVFVAMAVAAVVAAVVVIGTAPRARAVAIPFTDEGYSPKYSQVIRSQAELEEYLVECAGRPRGWERIEPGEQPQPREAFVNGLRASGVDFRNEVLVVGVFAASGEPALSGPPSWSAGVCVCRFRSTPPKSPATLTRFTIAYVIPTRTVTEVVVTLDGSAVSDVFPPDCG